MFFQKKYNNLGTIFYIENKSLRNPHFLLFKKVNFHSLPLLAHFLFWDTVNRILKLRNRLSLCFFYKIH